MSTDILTRAEAVAALRAAADLIESLPIEKDSWFVSAEAYNLAADDLATAARTPGTWTKNATDTMFEISQGIVALHGNRSEVCEARETGNTVKVRKVVKPAEYEEVEIPEVVWDCKPLLSKVQS